MLRPLPTLGNSNKRRNRYVVLALLAALVLALVFGGSLILSVFSSSANALAFPLTSAASVFREKVSFGASTFFSSKAALVSENTDLKSRLETMRAEMLDRDMLLLENRSLKEALGRREEEETVLASVLSRPNRSPYDTLLIDVGTDRGLRAGDYALGLGSVVIGRVAAVYERSALVKLLSAPGEEQEVMIGSSTPGKAIGVGGGNFRVVLPKGSPVAIGDSIVFPAINSRIFGKVEEIATDDSDTFVRVFFQSPVNIFELRWIEILQQ
ncbi:rod shape-determining protein MreC [Candidatus Parcubacteria bacterium]|nr:rod shape-determining protein MreC [Candidatus Parcubacteria bacterium]